MKLIGTEYQVKPSEEGVYLTTKNIEVVNRYMMNRYSQVNSNDGIEYYITTNERAMIYNSWSDDIKYKSYLTEDHSTLVSITLLSSKVNCDKLINRVFSHIPSVEVVDYYRYSAESYNNSNTDMVFLMPSQYIGKYHQGSYKGLYGKVSYSLSNNHDDSFDAYVNYLSDIELLYNNLLNKLPKSQLDLLLPGATIYVMNFNGFVRDVDSLKLGLLTIGEIGCELMEKLIK